MRVERCATAAELLARAGTFLEAREPEHNLLLAILGRLATAPDPHAQPAYLAAVESDGLVVAVALRTPPYGPVLSEIDRLEAVDAVADDLHSVYGCDMPGVLGPKEAAARFAQRWGDMTGRRVAVSMEERIYRCDRVRLPEGVPGRAREYREADEATVLSWLRAFWDEALDGGPQEAPPAEWLEQRLAEPGGAVVLWEHDDAAVSFASCGGATPSGLRVGPVYTPPEHRGRGYGGAVTAAVTDRALRSGRRSCFLFTNLANPTSNSIYMRIGYDPVTDVDQWRFDAAAPAG